MYEPLSTHENQDQIEKLQAGTKSNFLRIEINKLKTQLKALESQLDSLMRSCSHAFSEPIYTPIHTRGYTAPGDPPGTMGVDWRGPISVGPSTVKEWSRVCKLCGKVEKTCHTKKQKISGSVPGTIGEVETPFF